MAIASATRRRLPPSVSPAYFDAFVARNRPALLALSEQALKALADKQKPKARLRSSKDHPSRSLGRAVARFLERINAREALTTSDHLKLVNKPYQDLVFEWVVTPQVWDGAPMLSMAHYANYNGDTWAELEVVFRVQEGLITDHAFVTVGSQHQANPSPDRAFLNTWLKNIVAQGFRHELVPPMAVWELPAELRTKKQRTDANLAAMRIAAAKEPSRMTREDLQRLALYSGWGGLTLRGLDFPEGFPKPEPRGLIHEFYTPGKVTAEVVRVLEPLLPSLRGGDGKLVALEPSAGIGRFVNAAHHLRDVDWKVVEYSALSARMLAAMRPDLAVFEGSFERWVAENEAEWSGRVGLVLSNPPYGMRGASIVEDPRRAYREKVAYAYFLRRALDLLAPGGVGVFLVPGGFLTGKSNATLREKVLKRHHLMSAYRLPSGLFPGAELVTDLLFFRSRGGTLTEPAKEDARVLAGEYFLEFPDHILGKEVGRDGGEDDQTKKPRWGYQVVGEFKSLPDLIERPMCGACELKAPEEKPARRTRTRQTMTRTRGEATEALDGLAEKHLDAVRLGDRVDRYLAEVGKDSPAAAQLWGDLSEALQAWKAAHGNPHNHAALRKLARAQGVTGAQRVLAAFTKGGELAAELATKPVVRARYTGRPDDVKAQAATLFKAQHQLRVSELVRFHKAQGGRLAKAGHVVGELVKDGSWAVDWTGADAELWPMTEYLSGWLWDRYDRALAKSKASGPVAALALRQAEALLKAIRPVVYDEIDDVSPQQTWVPLQLLQDWLSEAHEVELTLGRCEGLVCVDGVPYEELDSRGFRVGKTWVSAEVEWVLGWINHDKTLFSPRKIGALRDEHLDQTRLWYAAKWTEQFHEWVAQTPDRKAAVEQAYNRRFRGFVPPAYSDAPLQMARWDSSRIRPHTYQNASVRRLEAHRGGLLAYDVGLGKTYTGLALLARARQEGWARRPVILVPNSIVWKWHADIQRVLPDFRVGVVGSRMKRRQLPALEAQLAKPLDQAIKAYKAKHKRGRKGVELLHAIADGLTQVGDLERSIKGVEKGLDELEAVGAVTLTRPPDHITSVNDTPAERAATWTKLQTGQLDVVLLTYTALARTRMNEDAVVQYAEATESIRRTIALQRRNAKNKSGNLTERQEAILAEGVRAWVAEQMEIPESWEYDPGVAWDDIGIDLLICDEAQNFKNLYLPEAREGGVPRFMGNSGSGSKRAWQLDFRLGVVRRNANGAGVVLLSATPAKNSPLEFYNLLQYVDHEVWTRMGIHNPEAFIDRYCQIEMRMVLNSKMAAEQKSACVGFKNLHELRDVLFRYGEFKTADQVGLELPEPAVHLVRVDMNTAQDAKYEQYVEQVKKALKAPPKSKERAQVLGLLARMALVAIHPNLDEGYDWKTAAASGRVSPHSPKFDALARNVVKDSRSNPGCGHIVFVDNVAAHRWVVEVLVKKGVPRDRIAVLNAKTAKAAARRQQIAQAFNGDPEAGVKPLYDVVIANAIAYEGIDLQTRTCAIHHLDLPWEPATLQQRNGRGHRQGNRNSSIGLYYYFANRSQDGQRFQLIQGKRGWMTALIASQDRATNNPGAALDMGPEETLLLVSRDPEATKKLLAELAEKRKQVQREKALKSASRHLKVLNSLLRRIEASEDVGERNKLRADARDRLEALQAIEAEDWTWKDIALREVKKRPLVVTIDGVPLWEGQRLTIYRELPAGADESERGEGTPIEIGSIDGTVHYRHHGGSRWTELRLSERLGRRAIPRGLDPDWDSASDWAEVNRNLDRNLRSLRYGELASTLQLPQASEAFRKEVWALHGHRVLRELASASYSYVVERQFVPDVTAGELRVARGAAISSAEVLPPTDEGWERFLALVSAGATELKLPELRKLARYWWGRPVPNSALPSREEAA